MLAETIQSSVITAVEGFGGAIEGAFSALVSGSENAGVAFRNAMLGAIAEVARQFGRLYIAKGVAAAATGNFASAAKFGLAAGLMFALSGGVSGLASGGGGGSSTSSNLSRDNQAANESKGDATVIVQGGMFNMHDPKQQQAFSEMINSLSGRRVIVRNS
jgi:hypothetical protein